VQKGCKLDCTRGWEIGKSRDRGVHIQRLLFDGDAKKCHDKRDTRRWRVGKGARRKEGKGSGNPHMGLYIHTHTLNTLNWLSCMHEWMQRHDSRMRRKRGRQNPGQGRGSGLACWPSCHCHRTAVANWRELTRLVAALAMRMRMVSKLGAVDTKKRVIPNPNTELQIRQKICQTIPQGVIDEEVPQGMD